MKKKTPHNSTKKKTPPKVVRDKDSPKSPWLEDYLDCFTFKMSPVTQKFLDRVSNELITWAKTDPDAFKISQFYLDKGFQMKTYYDWVKKYPIMKTAHSQALELIGNRREIGAMQKKLDTNIVSHMMPHYDPQWKEMVQWRNKLKAEADEKSGTKIVVMERFPSSELVPNKTEKV